MLKKEKRFRYGDHYVCRADHDSLNEIDNKLGSLELRLEEAIKMLENKNLEDNYKRQLSRFMNTTYPNSKAALEEKRRKILDKYKHMPKPLSYNGKIRLTTIIVVVALALIILVSASIIDKNNQKESKLNKMVYVSQTHKTYHYNDYCTKLTSIDKQEKITVKDAIENNYTPCEVCGE